MAIQIIRVLLFLLPFSVFAHSPDEAFFTVSESNDTTTIKAELPWTIKRGLLSYSPELKESNNVSDYKNTFFKYVEEHLQVENKNGNLLKLISVEEFHIKGAHTDQHNFTFTYLGKPFKITNRILFNVFKTQQNHHFLNNDDSITFTTTVQKPSIELPSNNYIFFLTIGFTSIMLVGFLYYFWNRTKRLKKR